MAVIERVRVILTGAQGLPGVCTFYAIDGATAADDIDAFFSTNISRFAKGVSAQVEQVGDQIADISGHLTGTWTGGTSTVHTSAATAIYSGGVGCCVTWLTDTILDYHRIKGRTFMVPLDGGQYQNDGTMDNTALAALQATAVTLVGATTGNLVVWHRPVVAKPADGSRKAIAARDGSHAVITGAIVHDKVAMLRSRRD